MATKWQVKVKTGAPVVYNTLSTVPAVAAFKGQAVVLNDYLTPFKAMLDNQLFRATDLGSTAGGFVGVPEYLAAVQKGENPSWDSVGIQLNPTEGAIEFEFKSPKTPFYAMYNLSSSLYSPVPAAFLTAIGGVANYGKPNIDSIISLGMYNLEEWQSDKQLAFKKNPTYFEAGRNPTPLVTSTQFLLTTTLPSKNSLPANLIALVFQGRSTYKNDPRTQNVKEIPFGNSKLTVLMKLAGRIIR